MGCRLIPDISVGSIYDISPRRLRDMGVSLLLMDLDNTMSPYHIHKTTTELTTWVDSMKAEGIEPFILSNNRGERPARFAAQLDIGYVGRAKKPSEKVMLGVMAEKGVSPGNTAVIGDQIFTDTLCAKRGGVLAILVKPICVRRNPLLALRYGLELPFRLMARRKNNG